jgi:glycosyltransferase involved in cell wall biosynthesis
MKKNKNKNNKKYPFVSVCTPTFNRRPFIQMIIKCFNHQTYPKDRIEWLILDDGTDKIEDLVAHLPHVKYLRYEEKMTLGKKRNILNDTSKGDIIIYMDDDDYYPPERISHAVETLKNSTTALCAGSSEMLIFFKHINKMYKFGPYGPNHATAATFAFKKELLKITRFNELSSVAEEKQFLKDYTIPFIQLESRKSIVVFSHEHNSFDKKELLKQIPNPTITDSLIQPTDLIQDIEILNFFMKDIDKLLKEYDPGRVEHKKDVTKQLEEIRSSREKMIHDHQQRHLQQQMQRQNIINQQKIIIQQLQNENENLKHKIEYLEKKITEIINDKIESKKEKEKTQDINE